MDYENFLASPEPAGDNITVSHHFRQSRDALPKTVKNDLDKQLINLARRMAGSNPEMKKTLIDIFRNVNCEIFGACVFTGKRLKNRQIFFISRHGYDEQFDTLPKPNWRRFILPSDSKNQFYIPVADTVGMVNIPFRMTAENISEIEGATGRKLRAAFKQGQATCTPGKKTTAPRLRREESLTLDDLDEDETELIADNITQRISKKERAKAKDRRVTVCGALFQYRASPR